METVNCARSEAVKKRAAAAKDIKEEPRAAACMPRSSFGGDGETKKLKVGIEPAEELKETRARNISFVWYARPSTNPNPLMHPPSRHVHCARRARRLSPRSSGERWSWLGSLHGGGSCPAAWAGMSWRQLPCGLGRHELEGVGCHPLCGGSPLAQVHRGNSKNGHICIVQGPQHSHIHPVRACGALAVCMVQASSHSSHICPSGQRLSCLGSVHGAGLFPQQPHLSLG